MLGTGCESSTWKSDPDSDHYKYQVSFVCHIHSKMKLLTAFITILALLSGLSNSVPVNASDLYKLRFGGGLHPLARFSASKGKNLIIIMLDQMLM